VDPVQFPAGLQRIPHLAYRFLCGCQGIIPSR
jgi:hypothetical protein